jgi:dipeptidyl aminopeptidase/acylaminoacyl peptidase
MIVSFFVFSTSVFSQSNPKIHSYNHNLDSIWSHNTYIHKISPDGNWILFTEVFENNHINYLAKSDGEIYKTFQKSSNMEFSPDSKWVTIQKEDNLALQNLVTNEFYSFENIVVSEFSKSGLFLIMEDNSIPSNLYVFCLSTFKNRVIKNVNSYLFDSDFEVLVTSEIDKFKSKNLIKEYNLRTNKEELIYQENSLNSCLSIWLYENGNFIFETKSEDDQRLIWSHKDGKQYQLTVNEIQKRFPDISKLKKIKHLSNNEDYIIISSEKDDIEEDDFLTLKTSDKYVLPRMQSYKRSLSKGEIIWKPLHGIYDVLENNPFPVVKGLVEKGKALVYDPLQYEPSYSQKSFADIFLKDLNTDNLELVVKNQYVDSRYIKMSPSGRYVIYFKGEDWYLYDSESKQTKNITNNVPVNFVNEDSWEPENKKPFGHPGWIQNEEKIIIYDEYDIWLFDPDKDVSSRLTRGRENFITYRINWQLDRNFTKTAMNTYNLISKSYEEFPIILDITGDNLNSGFALWDENNEVSTIIYSESFKDLALLSEDRSVLTYRSSKYNQPFRINSFNLQKSESYEIYQSNKELKEYDLGQYELIQYSNKDGDILKATLLYPANFDPSLKYPVITYIYENNSKSVNFFSPPSMYDSTGFNILNYILDGYFILLPDIKYKIGEPGKSAADCVISSVSTILEKKFLDPSRIGLIGHSFGGYEAAFIATQTDIFKTVVVGAPVTDLVSFYHDIQWGWGDTQATRLETQQFRMGASYYNMRDKYVENSPLHQIEKLNTPLLIWSGKNDTNINSYQSILLYTAMRRLAKEGLLLIFDEDHTLLNKVNQKHLSTEIHKWFEDYLKN